MDDPIVVAEGLTKSFGEDAGVFDLDLNLYPGQITGFIGPSGSGKTTTVRMMAGILAPDSGSIRVYGEDPMGFDADTRARIGYMPQQALLYPDLTLRENLNFAASLYGMPYDRESDLDRLIGFVELEGAIDRLPRQASGGEQRRVMLASTLIHRPDMIFLDEPTAGIDPVLRRKIWDRFKELADEGRTLFVTTQYVGEAAYCDYVAVLAQGRVLAYDEPEELRKVAFGGELLDIVFAERPTRADISELTDKVGRGNVEWLDGQSLRLAVEDAGSAAPAISNWAQERGLALNKVEAYLPPYDDVFVELVDALSPAEAEAGRHAR